MFFSYCGKELYVTTNRGLVKMLDYPSMETTFSLPAHTTSCYCVEVAPTGMFLATGGSDALLTLWDTNTWVCKRTFDKEGKVGEVSFSFDGAYLVGGSEDGTGLDINHIDGDVVHTIPTTEPAPHVQWSPKDYRLAYAPGDSTGGFKIVGGGT
jgi:THO complex subunit 3